MKNLFKLEDSDLINNGLTDLLEEKNPFDNDFKKIKIYLLREDFAKALEIANNLVKANPDSAFSYFAFLLVHSNNFSVFDNSEIKKDITLLQEIFPFFENSQFNKYLAEYKKYEMAKQEEELKRKKELEKQEKERKEKERLLALENAKKAEEAKLRAEESRKAQEAEKARADAERIRKRANKAYNDILSYKLFQFDEDLMNAVSKKYTYAMLYVAMSIIEDKNAVAAQKQSAFAILNEVYNAQDNKLMGITAFYIGKCYLRGTGTNFDHNKARAFFENASKFGLADGQCMIYYMNHMGYGLSDRNDNGIEDFCYNIPDYYHPETYFLHVELCFDCTEHGGNGKSVMKKAKERFGYLPDVYARAEFTIADLLVFSEGLDKFREAESIDYSFLNQGHIEAKLAIAKLYLKYFPSHYYQANAERIIDSLNAGIKEAAMPLYVVYPKMSNELQMRFNRSALLNLACSINDKDAIFERALIKLNGGDKNGALNDFLYSYYLGNYKGREALTKLGVKL